MTRKTGAARKAAVKPVADDPAVKEAVKAVIEAGAFCGARGWVPATSGNFSVRIDETRTAMTATGTDKSALTARDVLIAGINDAPHPKASAEAALHLALYREFPDAGAVFHVHSMICAVAGQLYVEDGQVVLKGAEVLKALAGTKTHETEIRLPVFPNSQDIPALAEIVMPKVIDDPAAHGFLLAGHGLYAWGKTPAEAQRHLEALDYLLTYTLELERYRR